MIKGQGAQPPYLVPSLADAAAWIGPAPLITLGGNWDVLSISLASENSRPIFAEISALAGDDYSLVASVRNWTEPVPDLSAEDMFDHFVLHYLSSDPTAFPLTVADDYREPEPGDARPHEIVLDGVAAPALRIDRVDEFSGVLVTLKGRLITYVWDPSRTDEPALVTA